MLLMMLLLARTAALLAALAEAFAAWAACALLPRPDGALKLPVLPLLPLLITNSLDGEMVFLPCWLAKKPKLLDLV